MTEADAQDILLGPVTKPITKQEWMSGSTYTFAMPMGNRHIVCMDSAVFDAVQSAARARCASCRFWSVEADDEYERRPDGFGSCRSLAFYRVYGANEGDLTPASIAIEDDEGWGCFTGPEFGCVHFEIKP
jgi:hypothetical protein